MLDYIRRFVPLNAEEILLIEKYFQPQSFYKNEILFTQGKPRKWIAFVEEGLLRAYRKVKKKEVTLLLKQEHDFIGSLTSYSNRLRRRYIWQALEHTHVLLIAKEDHLQLMERSQNYRDFVMKLLEQTLTDYNFRMDSLLSLDAKERYLEFLQNNHQMMGRINQYQLASYLGIAPQSLSRIRNKHYRNT